MQLFSILIFMFQFFTTISVICEKNITNYINITTYIEAVKPLEDLCINSRIYHSLSKNKNPYFQKISWDTGCQKRKETINECYNSCSSPKGCCGTTCASNSCSGGGCCSASRTICKNACDFFFSPKSFEITQINQTNWINETMWINETKINWINETKINWINKTKINWINKTKINWINKTRWINETNIINKKIIEWINKTNIVDMINWINKEKVNWINKTTYIDKELIKWNNKTNHYNINNDIVEKDKINNKNSTGINIDFNNLYVLGGVSICGLFILMGTFYIAWKCWLKDNIEEMILDWLCCGHGEQFMNFMELFGFFEDWKDREETRKVASFNLIGLTPQQQGVLREVIKTNKIILAEAVKIRWKELAKKAIRPKHMDEHIERHTIIEMNDLPTKKEETPPGTPRRRKTMFI